MKSNIFIPKKIKIGFNLRNDTYTGKLGYVIYHDGKKWRKEESWESWRQKHVPQSELDRRKVEAFNAARNQQIKYYNEYSTSTNVDSYAYKQIHDKTLEEYLKQYRLDSIDNFTYYSGRDISDNAVEPIEFENVPTEGFVLNKKAGGYSTGWNHRNTYCRVFDPRGFEFEITIPNLLYILDNSTSIKGKGLEGKFIYGWEGKDLVLIPEDAPEYKEMVEFTEMQSSKVSKKDLLPGNIYLTSSGDKVVYLCKGKKYDYSGVTDGNDYLWFCNPDKKSRHFRTLSISTLKKEIGKIDNLVDTLDELDQYVYFKPKKDAKIYSYELHTEKELQNIIGDSYRRYYGNEIYIEAKKKGNYKTVSLIHNKSYNYDTSNYNNSFYLQRGRKGEKFTEDFVNIKDLIIKYPLYKRITITQNEEKEQ